MNQDARDAEWLSQPANIANSILEDMDREAALELVRKHIANPELPHMRNFWTRVEAVLQA